MGRLGTFSLVLSMLVPATALAEAAVHAEQGMCSEVPAVGEAYAEAWSLQTVVEQEASAAAQSAAQAASAQAAVTDPTEAMSPDVVAVAPLFDPRPTTVLWCLTPDDPRCSPNQDGQGGPDPIGGELGRNAVVPAVAPAPRTTISHPRSLAGEARSAHDAGIERPPRA